MLLLKHRKKKRELFSDQHSAETRARAKEIIFTGSKKKKAGVELRVNEQIYWKFKHLEPLV